MEAVRALYCGYSYVTADDSNKGSGREGEMWSTKQEECEFVELDGANISD